MQYFVNNFMHQVCYLQEITRYGSKLKKLRLEHLKEFWYKEVKIFKQELKWL